MELVEKLMKLNILYIREMDRRKLVKLKNMGQLTEPLGIFRNTGSKVTVFSAITYLKKLVDKNSKIQYLKDEVSKLEEEICNSSIKDCKFWTGRLNEKEKELSALIIKRLFIMDTSLVEIKAAAEYTGLTETAIKQACQQERLLNTRKLSKGWLVHLPEVRAYWNVPETDEKYLDSKVEY